MKQQTTNSVDTQEYKQGELESLTNALNYYNLKGYSVHERFTTDKREKINKYFVSDDKGNSITGTWDYNSINHFIGGYGSAYKKLTAAPSIQSKEEGKHTPGKLYISEDNKALIMVDGMPIADASFIAYRNFKRTTIEVKANAARIVQCWNEHDQLKQNAQLWFDEAVSNRKEAGDLKAEVKRLKELNEELEREVNRLQNTIKGRINKKLR